MAPVVMLACMRPRPRAIAAGAAVAAATVLPFVLWRWRPTFEGIFYFTRAPLGFRQDSDSLTALAAQMFGIHSQRSLGVITQFAVGAVAYVLFRRDGLAGLLLASALSLLATFLFATQAFFNYYYYAGAVLLLSSLVLAQATVDRRQSTVDSPQSHHPQ